MYRYLLLAICTIAVLFVSCSSRRRSSFVSAPQAIETPQISNEDFFIIHSAYKLSYNPQTFLANWVAYELTTEETEGVWSRKDMHFVQDPCCGWKQADNEDYRNSGYSRGHLAPAGDMKWDSVAMLESFYFTNCIPQDEALNNGRWNQLEMKARALARDYGKVYVVCGPVFLNEDTLRIGPSGVAVPAACYKALLIRNKESYSSIGFIMLNGGESRSIKECACTVDELEALLGLNLFYNLPDDIEEGIESMVTWDDWNLR